MHDFLSEVGLGTEHAMSRTSREKRKEIFFAAIFFLKKSSLIERQLKHFQCPFNTLINISHVLIGSFIFCERWIIFYFVLLELKTKHSTTRLQGSSVVFVLVFNSTIGRNRLQLNTEHFTPIRYAILLVRSFILIADTPQLVRNDYNILSIDQ